LCERDLLILLYILHPLEHLAPRVDRLELHVERIGQPRNSRRFLSSLQRARQDRAVDERDVLPHVLKVGRLQGLVIARAPLRFDHLRVPAVLNRAAPAVILAATRAQMVRAVARHPPTRMLVAWPASDRVLLLRLLCYRLSPSYCSYE
jgi:hypothetical protein